MNFERDSVVVLLDPETVQQDFLKKLALPLAVGSLINATFLLVLSAPWPLSFSCFLFGGIHGILWYLLNHNLISSFYGSQVVMTAALTIISYMCIATGGCGSPFLVLYTFYPYALMGRMEIPWIRRWLVLAMTTMILVIVQGHVWPLTSALPSHLTGLVDWFFRVFVVIQATSEGTRFTRWSTSMIGCLISEKEKANQAATAKSQFLAVMSHEIRTPLQGVLGWVQLLLLEPSLQQNTDTKCKLNYLSQSCCMLNQVVSNILDYSKIQEGKFVAEDLTFSASELISSIVNSISYDQSQIAFSSDSGDLPLFIGPYWTIKQCLSNLLSNAFKFTATGKVHVHCTVENTAALDEIEDIPKLKLTFTVVDTGTGIPPRHLKKLFLAFQQADLSISRSYGGTGLGLAIVKSLSQLMSGDAWCDYSEQDQGSSFSFSCVVRQAPSDGRKPFVSVEPEKLLYSRSGRPVERKLNTQAMDPALVVDDNKLNQLFMQAALKKLQVPYLVASDGEEAISIFQHHKLSIIFMDLHMPGMDGYTAAAEIRRCIDRGGDTMEIIAVTGDNRADTEGPAHLFSSFLTKPVSLQQLSECVKDYCERVLHQ